jgi:predicted DNA-binding transcriptional regulator AlpA
MDARPQFLSAKECAASLGLEKSTFIKLVNEGFLPQPFNLTGERLLMWPREDVDAMAWLLKSRGRFVKTPAKAKEPKEGPIGDGDEDDFGD